MTVDRMNLGDNSRSSLSINPKIFRDGRTARYVISIEILDQSPDQRDTDLYSPSDIFIALMGLTGSGKSSFISLCCQKPAKIGHDLRACAFDHSFA